MILVVDDDPGCREIWTFVLGLDGIEVDQAENGLEALEKAKARHPSMVIADVCLPGIDGLELCRRLKADQTTREIPVVGLTGLSNAQELRKENPEFASILTKPCLPENLIAEVHRVLQVAAMLAERAARERTRARQLCERSDAALQRTTATALRAVVARIRNEYLEMPDLDLTAVETARFLAVPSKQCEDALDLLEQEGFVRQTSQGRYVRA